MATPYNIHHYIPTAFQSSLLVFLTGLRGLVFMTIKIPSRLKHTLEISLKVVRNA